MAKDDIDVSVIIPTFNRKSFLYPTLLCLIYQNLTSCKYEIIVIDSGSDETDRVINSLKPLAGEYLIYKRIPENKNRSLLRNIGAQTARGKLLIFIDNDMMVHPDFIETHYLRHRDRKEPAVLLGKRISLTEFDFAAVGEYLLINDFEKLDLLPHYRDVRDCFLDDKGVSIEEISNPWRFVFSHSLSILKEKFDEIEGFNPDFGDKWGYEDIELGFRCCKAGLAICMVKELPGYHQTHFEQSKTSQPEAIHSLKRFLSLHNCFELELDIMFYDRFEPFYRVLEEIRNGMRRDRYSSVRFSDYDLMLGCLISMHEEPPCGNAFLGVSLPFHKDNSVENVLILEEMHRFPVEMKVSILIEALRVSKDVNIEAGGNIDELSRLCTDIGWEIDITENENLWRITKTNKIGKRFFSLLLPDVCMPRKRFLFLYLTGLLVKNGFHISLNDPHGVVEFEGEDLSLDKDFLWIFDEHYKRPYGMNAMKVVASADMEDSAAFRHIQHPGMIVLEDREYLNRNDINKANLFRRYPSDEIESICFHAMIEAIGKNATGLTNIQEKESTICCFMENGYLEDGLDIVLEAFTIAVHSNGKLRLLIKMPDYDQLLAKKFPLHNGPSRQAKTYMYRQKFELDYFYLKDKINSCGLGDYVEILRKNLSLIHCLQLVQESQIYVSAARSSQVPVEAYAAILLKKKTVLPEHCRMAPELADNVTWVSSNKKQFYEEFGIPANSQNLHLSAYRTSAKELAEVLATGRQENEYAGLAETIITKCKIRTNEIITKFGNAGMRGPAYAFSGMEKGNKNVINTSKR